MTLAEFLLARYTEREAAAKATAAYNGDDWLEPWRLEQPAGRLGWLSGVDAAVARSSDPACIYPEIAEHIARNNPAYVLADIESKRQIVEFYRYEIDPEYRRYLPPDREKPPAAMALRLLALPFQDHPDYDPTWTPS